MENKKTRKKKFEQDYVLDLIRMYVADGTQPKRITPTSLARFHNANYPSSPEMHRSDIANKPDVMQYIEEKNNEIQSLYYGERFELAPAQDIHIDVQEIQAAVRSGSKAVFKLAQKINGQLQHLTDRINRAVKVGIALKEELEDERAKRRLVEEEMAALKTQIMQLKAERKALGIKIQEVKRISDQQKSLITKYGIDVIIKNEMVDMHFLDESERIMVPEQLEDFVFKMNDDIETVLDRKDGVVEQVEEDNMVNTDAHTGSPWVSTFNQFLEEGENETQPEDGTG